MPELADLPEPIDRVPILLHDSSSEFGRVLEPRGIKQPDVNAVKLTLSDDENDINKSNGDFDDPL